MNPDKNEILYKGVFSAWVMMTLLNAGFLALVFNKGSNVGANSDLGDVLLKVFALVCTITLFGVVFAANRWFFHGKVERPESSLASISLQKIYFYLMLLSGGMFITMTGFLLLSSGVPLGIAAIFSVVGQLLFFYLVPRKSFFVKLQG